MRKDILTNAVVFVIGLTTGAVINDMILRKKYQKRADDEINKVLNDVQRLGINKEPEVRTWFASEKTDEPTQDEVQSAVAENHYISNDEEPKTAGDLYMKEVEEASKENEAYMNDFNKKYKGKIKAITQEDWDSDFYETDYDREELYYFPNEDILADENSNTLEEKAYLSDFLDRYGFKTNPDPDEVVYIRNGILEKEFKVNKVLDCTKEDYLGPEPD